MEEQLKVLEKKLVFLEEETCRLVHNCERINTYQNNLFQVCRTWVRFLESSVVSESDNQLISEIADSIHEQHETNA